MEGKPYPAFGYVIVRVKLKAGEIVNDEVMQNNVCLVDTSSPNTQGNVISGYSGGFIWMLLSGVHTYTDVATGVVDRHERGFTNLIRPIKPGIHKFEVIEDSDYICISPIINENRSPTTPKLEHFSLSQNQSKSLSIGTKLYLVDGILNISGSEVSGMRQISIKSEDCTVTAISDCLGFIFKD